MQHINGGTFSPTLKIPYQNNRYFCEILIISLKNQQEYATTNALHPQIRHVLYICIFKRIFGNYQNFQHTSGIA